MFSKNYSSGFSPPNHPIFYRVFHYKSSILGNTHMKSSKFFHHNIQDSFPADLYTPLPWRPVRYHSSTPAGIDALTSAWNNRMTIGENDVSSFFPPIFQIIYSNWLSHTHSQDWNHHLYRYIIKCDEVNMTIFMFTPPLCHFFKAAYTFHRVWRVHTSCSQNAQRPSAFRRRSPVVFHGKFHAHDGSMGLVTGRFTYMDGWSLMVNAGSPMDPLFLFFDFLTYNPSTQKPMDSLVSNGMHRQLPTLKLRQNPW